jgi:predicted SnoaL-like aldol condensation-catalyzing enzyme
VAIKSNKEKAIHFLQLASKGNSREAFDLYIGQNFRHHNAFFPGDGLSLMKAMEEAGRTTPGKIFEVKRALEDGDQVAVHSHMKPNPEHPGYALMHIFRFENDSIAELWDFGQEVPEEMINENGMF